MNITKQDVLDAASQENIPVLAAIKLMLSSAAKLGDELALEKLLKIQEEIIFI